MTLLVSSIMLACSTASGAGGSAGFGESQAISLTESAVSALVPVSGVDCLDAEYRPGNHIWVVRCNLTNRQDEVFDTRFYTLDDRTGHVEVPVPE